MRRAEFGLDVTFAARRGPQGGEGMLVGCEEPPAGRVAPVALKVDLPFATGDQHAYRVQPLPLEPGDRLLFVTDGMLERNAANVNMAALVAQGAGMHPREAV